MELIWTVDIDDEAYFPFNHSCMPIIWKEKLFYAFYTVDKTQINEDNLYERKIVILEIDIKTKEILKKELYLSKNQNEKIIITKEWQFLIEENELILLVGLLKLNLSDFIIKVSENKLNLGKFQIKSHYNFTEKYITYNYCSILKCFDNNSNKLLWKQNIKGYLYTDVTVKGSLIFFGTAGKGGAFYTMNIDTGEVLVEFNNGDASEYSWSKSNIIIKDKKGNLVKLNPRTGEIINVLKLKEKIHFNSKILVS
jgi:outer membrane protein assembly factor BamB